VVVHREEVERLVEDALADGANVGRTREVLIFLLVILEFLSLLYHVSQPHEALLVEEILRLVHFSANVTAVH